MALLVVLASAGSAQQADSSVDVFPLAVGNKWLYQYQYHFYYFAIPLWIADSGKVEIEVVAMTSVDDIQTWELREHRMWQSRVISPSQNGGIDTVYTIDTTVSAYLDEMQGGQHELHTLLGSSVFSFADVDTTTVFRYQVVDANGTVAVIGDLPQVYQHHMLFRQNVGLQTDSMYARGVSISDRVVKLLASTVVPVWEIPPSGPNVWELRQNYPNPFNPTTTITFSLPEQSHVSLKVYDVLGRGVALLLDETKPAGGYAVQFDASRLPSGVYFCRIQAGEFVESKRMLLMR
jgi:hypothetical protein